MIKRFIERHQRRRDKYRLMAYVAMLRAQGEYGLANALLEDAGQ